MRRLSLLVLAAASCRPAPPFAHATTDCVRNVCVCPECAYDLLEFCFETPVYPWVTACHSV